MSVDICSFPYTEGLLLWSANVCWEILCGQYPEALLIPLHNCTDHQVWTYQAEVFLSSVGGIFWPITSILQWPNLNLQLLVTLAYLFVGKISRSGFQGGRVNVSIFRGEKANLYQWTFLWVITRLIFFKVYFYLFISDFVYVGRGMCTCVYTGCCQIQTLSDLEFKLQVVVSCLTFVLGTLVLCKSPKYS